MVFTMDFEKGFLSAYVDDMLCITYRLQKQDYDITKSAITM